MKRNLHAEMAAAAHVLAQSGKIATSSQRKLSQILVMVFGPPPSEVGEPESPQPGQRGKRPRTEVDKNYRVTKARKVYRKALQRGSCYFIAFALCVTATDCRDPETALFPEQDEHARDIQFSLHKNTLDLFRSWARFNGYDANEIFVGFMEQLREAPAEEGTAPALDMAIEPDVATEPSIERRPGIDDFEVVARIIADRGLTGNPTVREAMRIIFPEQAYKTWPLRFGLAPMVDTDNKNEKFDDGRRISTQRSGLATLRGHSRALPSSEGPAMAGKSRMSES